MGMPHAQIPSMLAKGRIGVPTLTLLELLLTLTSPLPLLTRSLRSAVLSGTKYTLKQARGRFGLGAKMVRHAPHPGIVGSLVLQALIWAKMTSGVALEVYTARQGAKSISHCVLDIDLHLNEPKVGGRPCPPLLRLTCLCHGTQGTCVRAPAQRWQRQPSALGHQPPPLWQRDQWRCRTSTSGLARHADLRGDPRQLVGW